MPPTDSTVIYPLSLTGCDLTVADLVPVARGARIVSLALVA